MVQVLTCKGTSYPALRVRILASTHPRIPRTGIEIRTPKALCGAARSLETSDERGIFLLLCCVWDGDSPIPSRLPERLSMSASGPRHGRDVLPPLTVRLSLSLPFMRSHSFRAFCLIDKRTATASTCQIVNGKRPRRFELSSRFMHGHALDLNGAGWQPRVKELHNRESKIRG